MICTRIGGHLFCRQTELHLNIRDAAKLRTTTAGRLLYFHGVARTLYMVRVMSDGSEKTTFSGFHKRHAIWRAWGAHSMDHVRTFAVSGRRQISTGAWKWQSWNAVNFSRATTSKSFKPHDHPWSRELTGRSHVPISMCMKQQSRVERRFDIQQDGVRLTLLFCPILLWAINLQFTLLKPLKLDEKCIETEIVIQRRDDAFFRTNWKARTRGGKRQVLRSTTRSR